MSEKPGYLRTLEYSARWGIEPMFSDFKSRGFGIEDTQLRYADRLDRLHMFMNPTGISINPATYASTIAGTSRRRRQVPPHGAGPAVGV